MKTKELRIGNLVSYEKTSHIIISIEEFNRSKSKWIKADRDIYSHINSELEPIPLTEEWLLKFGCNKYNDDGFFDCFGWVIDMTNERPYFGESYQQFCTPIDYVHQLQNLYFALTGEELIIKE